MPAFVQAPTLETLRHPLAWMASTICLLLTPLQLQICALSGRSDAFSSATPRRRAEEQFGAACGHLRAGHEHLHQRAGGLEVAEQDRAGDLAVADDRFL